MALLKKLATLTNPNAILTLHMPFWREEHLRPPANPVSIIVTFITRYLAKLGRGPSENLIQMHHYDLSDVIQILN